MGLTLHKLGISVSIRNEGQCSLGGLVSEVAPSRGKLRKDSWVLAGALLSRSPGVSGGSEVELAALEASAGIGRQVGLGMEHKFELSLQN